MSRDQGKAAGSRRLADMTIKPEPAPWRPDPDQCDDWVTTMPFTATARVHLRQTSRGTQSIDFAMTLQAFHQEAWHDVIRVDTSHDEVHAHYFDRSGKELRREVFHQITEQQDVERGYDIAEDLLMERHDECVTTWLAT